MKKTYSGTMAEISRLQERAEQLRKAESKGVIGRIREAIQVYGLTAQDLGFGAGAGASAAPPKAKGRPGPKPGMKPASRTSATAPKAPKAVTIGVAKYRDPKTGKTWTGRGKPPNWIAGAKNRDAFAIDAQGSASAGSSAAAPAAA